MKLFKYFIIIGILAVCYQSCEPLPAQPPAFRVINNQSASIWVALGTYDKTLNSAETISEWVLVESNSVSDFIYVTAGTYYVCYDWDSDHSGIQIPVLEKAYSPDQTYTITFKSDNTMNLFED